MVNCMVKQTGPDYEALVPEMCLLDTAMETNLNCLLCSTVLFTY
jgi:hypothetical protein